MNLGSGIYVRGESRAGVTLIRNNYVSGIYLNAIEFHGDAESRNEAVGNRVVDSRREAIRVLNTAGNGNYVHHNEVWNCARGIDYFPEPTVFDSGNLVDGLPSGGP